MWLLAHSYAGSVQLFLILIQYNYFYILNSEPKFSGFSFLTAIVYSNNIKNRVCQI